MVRSAKWRKILLVLAIVIALAGVGGTVVALMAYHDATKIDRTEPLSVVDAYLDAALVQQDQVGVGLYACAEPAGLASIDALRSELDSREQQFDVEIIVSWGSMARTQEGPRSRVVTELTITARRDGAVESKSRESWQFMLVDEGGWRVCAAEKVALPSPTPARTP